MCDIALGIMQSHCSQATTVFFSPSDEALMLSDQVPTALGECFCILLGCLWPPFCHLDAARGSCNFATDPITKVIFISFICTVAFPSQEANLMLLLICCDCTSCCYHSGSPHEVIRRCHLAGCEFGACAPPSLSSMCKV